MEQNAQSITTIIGLGNPGSKFEHNRHNIGFRVVDALCDRYHGSWKHGELMDEAKVIINGKPILLIKPQTFMNNSGQVFSALRKRGVSADNILVVHDELEVPFGQVKYRIGGSARGHNGLRSLIAACGQEFGRLRVGISRPERKEDVPDYVLQNFYESAAKIEDVIITALDMIEDLLEV